MATLLTRGDSLREYFTGAGSDGGTQSDPAACLGNYRASKQAVSFSLYIENPILGSKVEMAMGDEGIGNLKSEGNTLSWRPYGQDYGTPVVYAAQETRIVEGPTPGFFVRVSGRAPFESRISKVKLTELVNGVFGFNNVASSLAVTGGAKYRATIIRNETGASLTNVKRYLTKLGTSRVSNVAQLSGAGSGTITTTGSFADWPLTGWCRIENLSDVLKEIVYYSARTATSLTVTHRARLGTSAVAGAATDKIHAVPGFAIALDTNGVQNFGSTIATIANENTAPAGVTWNTGISLADGLSVATLATNKLIGLWMWRDIPAGMVYATRQANRMTTSFDGA